MKASRKPSVVVRTEKDVATDFKTFEALPAKAKVLARLQDEVARTTGPAAVALQKKIESAGRKPALSS